MALKWWGDFEIDPGAARFWQIGPFRLWATRFTQEWQLVTETTGDALANDVLAAVEPPEEPKPDAQTSRFGFRNVPGTIRLVPAPADRAVVVKAASPFFVPPGEEISLFVSTALWLQVKAGSSSELLLDVPLHRPSDSWFGSSTREGELCYATKTGARYHLENIPRRPHRAISVVRICNRAPSQLGLERLKLPLPNLSLYRSEDGQLWTEPVTLERDEEDENATVKLGRDAPRAAGKAKRAAGPRTPAEKGLLTRSFGGLFGWKGGGGYERVGE
jgi:hypothetical protein